MKKWLWILVISLPVFAAFETFSTVRNIDFSYWVTAPRYAQVTESQLTLLDNKALAKLSASLIADHKRMTEWWSSARDASVLMMHVLLGLVFALAAILAAILWRMPSNPSLNTDARSLRCACGAAKRERYAAEGACR